MKSTVTSQMSLYFLPRDCYLDTCTGHGKGDSGEGDSGEIVLRVNAWATPISMVYFRRQYWEQVRNGDNAVS